MEEMKPSKPDALQATRGGRCLLEIEPAFCQHADSADDKDKKPAELKPSFECSRQIKLFTLEDSGT